MKRKKVKYKSRKQQLIEKSLWVIISILFFIVLPMISWKIFMFLISIFVLLAGLFGLITKEPFREETFGINSIISHLLMLFMGTGMLFIWFRMKW